MYNRNTMIIENGGLVSQVKGRIKELIAKRDISIYDLAKNSDLTEACIRNWFTARNYTPSLEAIEKISKTLEVAPFELLCDKDEVLSATPENVEFAEKFRFLTKKQKQAILTIIESYSE